MTSRLLILLLLVPTTREAVADVPQCHRWVNGLHPCSVLADTNCLDITQSTWDHNQKLTYNNWYFSTTAQKACEKFVMKYDPTKLPAQAGALVEVDGIWRAPCYADIDGDGNVNYGEHWTNDMIYEAITPESCCFRTPRGNAPYTNVVDPNAPYGHFSGGSFSSQLRTEIKIHNQLEWNLTGNSVYSDLGTHRGDLANGLVWTTTSGTSIDDPDPDPTVPGPSPKTTFPPQANVDHIIPRVDSQGCPCGTNAPSNALVISAPLNQSMRNSCEDPRRKRILQIYTQ